MRIPFRRHIFSPAVLPLFCLLAAFAVPAAGQTPWLTLPRGADYRLPATDPTAMLRIPVRLPAGIPWRGVSVVVTDVHRDGRGDQWMRAAVDGLVKSPVNERGGPALLLPFAADSFRESGTYTVELEATAPRQVLQRLQLRLTRPAGQLSASPVQVRHERPWPKREHAWGGSVLIAETSGMAGIPALTPVAPLFAGPGGATLRFGDRPVSITAWGTARIPFEVDGELPLGSTTGTIRLASPQLDAPVDVPVTIVIHRPYWLLFAGIMFGLFLGWLVRTFLTRRIERNQLRLQADDVLVRMGAAVTTHSDANFRAAVNSLAGPLRAASDGGNTETLAAAITTADTGLRTALEALQTRLDAARERGVALGRLARTEWNLSPGLATALVDARKALVEAEGALAGRDAAGANQLLDKAEAGLKGAFRDAIDAWPIERTMVLDLLAALPPEVRTRAEPWVAAIRADVESVQQPGNDELESLRPSLTAMHRARLREGRLAEGLAEWVDALGAEVRAALTAGTSKPQALEQFQAALEAFRAGASGPDPDETVGALANNLTAMNDAFRSVVAAHMEPAAAKDVMALLEEGRYTDAAKRAAQQGVGEGRVLKGSAETPAAADAEGAAAGEVWAVAAPGMARADGVALHRIGIPEPVRGGRARALKQLMLDQALLTLIVGAAITILGYYLHSTDFVGTGRELLAILLWAFGLDVGVQTLVAQSARLAAPGAGGGPG